MLDTRTPPTSSRTRRSSLSARPDARRPAPGRFSSRSQAQAAPARERVAAEEPGRRALPSARSSRLGRSEMRLMGAATVCTAVVCALLLLYLAAYAQVTQLGIEQAAARTVLHRNQMRRQLLEAERNTLESPQRITAAAIAQGMAPRGRTPVDYVAARPAENALGTETHGTETHESDAQGNSTGGTTEDSRAAAPFGH